MLRPFRWPGSTSQLPAPSFLTCGWRAVLGGRLGHQMNRLVEEQPAARSLLFGARWAGVGILLVVPEHQRHVHVSGPEHAQRLRRLGLGQHEVHARAFRLKPGRGGRNDGAQRGRERRQPYPALAQPDVRRELVPYDERVENGITIEQRRTISSDDRFVEKRIRLRQRGKEYIERVRLLSAADLERLLAAAGFDVLKRFGDYSGVDWSEDSPRTILFASRR